MRLITIEIQCEIDDSTEDGSVTVAVPTCDDLKLSRRARNKIAAAVEDVSDDIYEAHRDDLAEVLTAAEARREARIDQ